MSGRRGLSIRAAVAADAAGLAGLLGAAGYSMAPAVLADRVAAATSGQGTVLAACEWGPPCGLVSVHWYDTLQGPRRTAQIDLLIVAPDDRRRGLGRLLLKAASQAARVAGCGAICLAVADEQTAAFCLATGFAEHGRRFTRALRKGA